MIKRIFRYFRDTLHLILTFRDDLKSLFEYSDVDWVKNQETRRFTFEYMFNLSSDVISWFFKRQLIVILSTCEVEYRAQIEVDKKVIWLKNLVTQLSLSVNLFFVVIHCDNQETIVLAKNSQFHARIKHVKI